MMHVDKVQLRVTDGELGHQVGIQVTVLSCCTTAANGSRPYLRMQFHSLNNSTGQ